MKPTAVIVNAARGGVVGEDALVRALKEKRLAGAALDVFEQEPLPADHPLRSLDNVVLTPHLGASTAEAQQNVALEIAEAVRAALVDGDLSRAVNAPGLGGEEMRKLRPLLDLAERLGALAAALAEGGIARVEVRYAGSAANGLRLLTATVLCGALSRVVGAGAVNTVNALHVAAAHGIRVDQIHLDSRGVFAEQLEIRATTDAGETRVAGALLGESHPRIVRIDDFRVDMVPRGTLLVLRNQDVPGVIGSVGTCWAMPASTSPATTSRASMRAVTRSRSSASMRGWMPSVLEALGRMPGGPQRSPGAAGSHLMARRDDGRDATCRHRATTARSSRCVPPRATIARRCASSSIEAIGGAPYRDAADVFSSRLLATGRPERIAGDRRGARRRGGGMRVVW